MALYCVGLFVKFPRLRSGQASTYYKSMPAVFLVVRLV